MLRLVGAFLKRNLLLTIVGTQRGKHAARRDRNQTGPRSGTHPSSPPTLITYPAHALFQNDFVDARVLCSVATASTARNLFQWSHSGVWRVALGAGLSGLAVFFLSAVVC